MANPEFIDRMSMIISGMNVNLVNNFFK